MPRAADHQEVKIRQATAEDFDAWVELYAAVAAEGRWIGAEAPVDRERRRIVFDQFQKPEAGLILIAEIDGHLCGNLGLEVARGIAELGMIVEDGWRGRGIGTRMLEAGISWAREHGVHKVTLTVWPHNDAAIALYRKFGFAEEGLLRRHYRRRNGELWDAIAMGLVLDWNSPGSSAAL
jgi:RimJ/RimL family protein N-acetyltransferase